MLLRCRDLTVDLSRPRIMGVVNVTPDSFSDGGLFLDAESAVIQARRLVSEGADLVDIGGESSRPGAEPVDEPAELRRVLPVVEQLSGVGVPISVDTYKPEVARACLEAGAHMINDITGAGDAMLAVAAEFGAPVVAMHMLGTPRTMQKAPHYEDVVEEIRRFFEERQRSAEKAGVQLVLDPGIGFGKTHQHNLDLLRRLGRFRVLGLPLLVGLSRKSFLGKITGRSSSDRLAATLAADVIAVLQGADIVRVHDVELHRDALAVVAAVLGGSESRAQRIFARGLRCPTHVGVGVEERSREQDVVIDVEAEVELEPGFADGLPSTVDYVALAEIARRVAGERPRELLETMAEEIAAKVLSELHATEVRVRIVKPAVAEKWSGRVTERGQFGVEVIRERPRGQA